MFDYRKPDIQSQFHYALLIFPNSKMQFAKGGQIVVTCVVKYVNHNTLWKKYIWTAAIHAISGSLGIWLLEKFQDMGITFWAKHNGTFFLKKNQPTPQDF